MIDAIFGENGIKGWYEFVRDRAAQAAIGELDDLRTGRITASLQDLAVDADVAELVDDHRKLAALRMRDEMPDERGLAGAEKAGDDGAGNARK